MSTSICMEMLASDSSASSGWELLKAERRNIEGGKQGGGEGQVPYLCSYTHCYGDRSRRHSNTRTCSRGG